MLFRYVTGEEGSTPNDFNVESVQLILKLDILFLNGVKV